MGSYFSKSPEAISGLNVWCSDTWLDNLLLLFIFLLIVCSFLKDLGQHPVVDVNIKLIKQNGKSRLVPPPKKAIADEQNMDEEKGDKQ